MANIPLHGLIVTNDIIDDARSFGGISQLHWCSTDGNRIRRVLLDHKIGDANFTTYDEQYRQTIHQAITDFFAPEDDSLRLLYFAGHGYRDDNGKLYLLVRDSTRKNLEGTTLPAEWLKEVINNSKTRRKVVILDCCYSAAIISKLRGMKSIGVEEVIQGQGTVVIASSGAAERARDGLESFTAFLSQGIENGRADRDGDGLVSLEEWFDYARDQIKENQKPRMFYTDRTSPIYIARLPKTAQNAPKSFEQRSELSSAPPASTGDSSQPALSLGQFSQPMPNDTPLITPIKAQSLVAKVRRLPPDPFHYLPQLMLSIRNFDTQDVAIHRITCRAENIFQEQPLGGGYRLAPKEQINLSLPDYLLDALNGFIVVYTISLNQEPMLALVAEIPTELSDLSSRQGNPDTASEKNSDAELHNPKIRPPSTPSNVNL